MNTLIYEKYKGTDNILMINLHNGYTIVAIKSWNKEKHIYNVELRLKENTNDKWDLIEKARNLIFNTNYRHINPAILKQVSAYLQEGFFNYYIQREKYEADCFDRGNDLYEQENTIKIPGTVLSVLDREHYKVKVKNNLYTVLARMDNGNFEPVLDNCYIKTSDIETLPDIIHSKINGIKNKDYIKTFVKSKDYNALISSIQNYKNSGCKASTLFKENLDCLEKPGLYISLWLYGKCIYNRILDTGSLIDIKKECQEKIDWFINCYGIATSLVSRINNCKNKFWKAELLFNCNGQPVIKIDQAYIKLETPYLVYEKIYLSAYNLHDRESIIFEIIQKFKMVMHNMEKYGYRIMEARLDGK